MYFAGGSITSITGIGQHIWLTGTIGSPTTALVKVTSLAPPTADYKVYLGFAKRGTYVNELSNSGVCYFRGGLLWRQTADTTPPTDTPANGMLFITKTPSGSFLWDGSQYHRIGPDGGPANIRWFGAKGEGAGGVIDRPAIQAAMDATAALGGGSVYVPGVDIAAGKYYRVDTPVFHRGLVKLFGDGRSSLIVNDSNFVNAEGEEVDFKNMCIMLGAFHPEDWEPATVGNVLAGVTYDLTAIAAGDFEVTPSSVSLGLIADGDIVFIRSNNQTSGTDNWSYLELNEVVSRTSTAWVLKYPVPTDIVAGPSGNPSGPKISKVPLVPPNTSEQGAPPCYILRNAGLRDLAFRSDLAGWCARTGFFECTFENLFIEKSKFGIYGNAMSHSLWSNIRGNFWNRGIELATGSSSTLIQNVQLGYQRPPAAILSSRQPPETIMAIQGVSRSIIIRDININLSGNAVSPVAASCLRIDGEDNLVDHATFVVPKLNTYMLAFSSATPNTINRRNTVRGSKFFCSAECDRYIQFGSPDSTSVLEDITIEGNQFYGLPSVADRVYVGGGKRIVIRDNYFEKADLAGYYIASTATARIEGNSSPTAAALTLLKRQEALATDKTNTTTADYKTLTIPAGTVRDGDVLTFRCVAYAAGITGVKNLNWLVGSQSVGAIQVATGDAGEVLMELRLIVVSATANQRYAASAQYPAAKSATARYAATADLVSNSLTVRLQGSVAAGQTITLELFSVDVSRPFEI